MGDKNLESLSKSPDLAKSIAARQNLLEIYGPGRQDRYLYDEGLRIQGEIRDTGTSEAVAHVLQPLGDLITNLPGTLTELEQREVRALAGFLESTVGGFNLAAVVLTWVMREPVRRGDVSLELMQKRPAQPKSLAETLRSIADKLEGTTLSPPEFPIGNIHPFRKPPR